MNLKSFLFLFSINLYNMINFYLKYVPVSKKKIKFYNLTVKPTSINITAKPRQFASEIEYSISCEVIGSIPETDIRWTQNNRPFKRGKVI